MRLLILGITGMLGHKLFEILDRDFEVFGTLRNNSPDLQHLIKGKQVISVTNIENIEGLEKVLEDVKPDAVINCIGVVKQLETSKDPVTSIAINALFPHQMARICIKRRIRFIHYSTDCVFSGRRGNYSECDFADADDLYGRTKYLGEVHDGGCLTLRTSIIGREIKNPHSLVEWFLASPSPVPGYTKAIFSGLTTVEHAHVMKKVLLEFPDLNGMYHLSADPISKHDLLVIINTTYGLKKEIVPDNSIRIDRSLDSTKFKKRTGIVIPSWNHMIQEMFTDSGLYCSGGYSV